MELTIVNILLIINLIWNLEEFQVTGFQSLLSSHAFSYLKRRIQILQNISKQN